MAKTANKQLTTELDELTGTVADLAAVENESEDKPAAPVEQAAASEPAPELTLYKPVHGYPLVDPFTKVRFEVSEGGLSVQTPWVETQVAAGFLMKG